MAVACALKHWLLYIWSLSVYAYKIAYVNVHKLGAPRCRSQESGHLAADAEFLDKI